MNEIERKIKQEANNSSFEFKEEYWDATLVKLKQAEKALLFKRIGWIFFGVLAIGSIAYFGFMKDNSIIDNDSIAANEIAINNIESTNSKIESTNNKIDNSTFNNNNILDNNNTNLNQNNLTNSTNQINNNSNTPSDNVNDNTENSFVQTQNDVSNSNNNNNNNNNLNTNSSSRNNTSRINRVADNNSSNTNNLARTTFNPNSGNQLQPAGSKRNFSVDEIQTNLGNESEKTKSDNPTKPTYEIDKSKVKINQAGLVIEDLIPYEYVIYNKLATKFSPLPVVINKNINTSKFVVQAFIGTNISKSFGEQNKTTFDVPYGGMEIGYLFKNKLLFTSGIGWYQKSESKFTIDSKSQEIYSYGLTKTTQSILLNKSYWLEIPLKISYPIFNQKHRIGLGFSYSHLLGSESFYSTKYAQTFFKSDKNIVQNTEKTIYGSKELFTGKIYSLLGSYQFQYNRFGTEIKFHYGLNDMLKHKPESIEKTNRITLTLKYSLF